VGVKNEVVRLSSSTRAPIAMTFPLNGARSLRRELENF
jgi:hypothetical protein